MSRDSIAEIINAAVPLGSVIDLFDDRRIPLNSRERQQRPGEFRYYGAQGVIDHVDAYLFDGRFILIAEDGANLVTRKLPIANLVSGQFWVNNHAHVIRSKPGIADDQYLLHWLNWLDIKAFVTGAAQPKLSQASLASIPIILPSIDVQRRIGAVLHAYEDLIENNLRRIQILEEMARALYREWFVLYRYPESESSPLVNSRIGPVPTGWTVGPVTESADVNPRVRIPKEGDKPFVPMRSLSEGSMLITDIETRDGNSGSKFQNGDTLFARITPCLENGKTGFVQFLPDEQAVAFGSTEFIVLRSRTVSPEFVYLLARSDSFRGHAIKSMTGATGRQRVQESCFEAYLLAEPPADLIDRFTAITRPMFRLIQQLHLQIENLRRTRDLLLPRLMSGRLTLREAEATV